MMIIAIGVRMEFGALSHIGPIISRVHGEQLGVLQRPIPNSSQQVQSEVALGIALSAIRALLAKRPELRGGS